jgi:hypothetical protein
MSPIDEPSTFNAKSAPAEGGKTKAAPAAAPEPQVITSLVAFTVDTETGRVTRIEGVSASGDRSEIAEGARAALAEKAKTNLQALVEQAFEAGVHCVLGSDEADEPEAADDETEDDADLRRVILRSLIERSAARRLIQREVLGKAIVGTLISQGLSTAAHGSNPGGATSFVKPASAGGRGAS